MNKDRFLPFKNFSISRELMLDLNRVILGSGLGMVFFSTYNGAPFAGFVRSLGVGDFLFGVLMAFPVMGGLFQVLSAYVLERSRQRKKLFLISGVIQRISIIPMVLFAYILPSELKPLSIGLIMFMLTLSALGGSFNGVTFFSWMSAIVPINIRGRFFSKRQLIFTITSLLGGLGVGYLLDLIGGSTGFIIVFVIAAIFGLLDVACFVKVADPPMDMPEDEKSISLIKVWKEALGNSGFRKYITFWALWTFAVNLTGPFFNDYMIHYLNMGYLQITLFTSAIYSLFTVFSIGRWGRLIDKYGNKPVMYICGLAVFLIPFMWIFTTPNFTLMIIFIHILSGVFWCGMELTANNMTLSTSPEKNKSFYIATISMVTALAGSILAYFTGGLFMELTRGYISSLNIMLLGYPVNSYHLLFLIGSLLRGAAVIFLLPMVEETDSKSPHMLVKDTYKQMTQKIRGPRF
ncbi:MAG TPA: MFS transporter [Bacillota bacterium]|nr:MFS transporter [Bacillota bacterium]